MLIFQCCFPKHRMSLLNVRLNRASLGKPESMIRKFQFAWCLRADPAYTFGRMWRPCAGACNAFLAPLTKVPNPARLSRSLEPGSVVDRCCLPQKTEAAKEGRGTAASVSVEEAVVPRMRTIDPNQRSRPREAQRAHDVSYVLPTNLRRPAPWAA